MYLSMLYYSINCMTDVGHPELGYPSPIGSEDSVLSTPQCPKNVSPKAWELFGIARERGELGRLTEGRNGARKAQVLGLFIGEGLSLREIGERLGIASKYVRYFVLDGIKRVWQSLPADLQQQFPREKIESVSELHNPQWR